MAERQPIRTQDESRARLRSKKPDGSPVSITGDGDEAARQAAADREKLTSGLSSGKAAKGGGADMPKQEPGETAVSYGERLRKWRASKPSAANQAKALGGQ